MDHHPHGTQDRHHQAHPGSGGHDQRRVLDLDAEVFGENLAAALNLGGVSVARGIVDLGAGSGAGSRLLRQRYPDAEVTCVDNDPYMLELLREQGFTVVEADLSDGFPALYGSVITPGASAADLVDLVWASSSLHHVAHPGRLLSGVRRALAPGGVLIVVELADLPSFLGHSGGALLEQRCHAAAAAEGWNHYPDWTPVLKDAGFAVSKSELTTIAPVTTAAREYAGQWFARFSHLAALTADDRNAVDDIVRRFPDDLELEPRATRTIWVATPVLPTTK
jgi:SAM-dependent methyltransferase